MKYPKFSKEVEDFLGKYEILTDRYDYDVYTKIKVVCEDGREYEEKCTGYGLGSPVLPYDQYEKLEQKIKKAMAK